jgi:5S rRNA maturation endonuclease (ribonuclease M5)
LCSLERKIKELELILQELAQRSNEGAIIITEGINDMRALRSLGIKGKIFCIKRGKISLTNFLTQFVNEKAEFIILTDFDRRGRELAGRIAGYLERYGKSFNLTFRAKISSFISRDVKDIEGLPSYIENLERRMKKYSLLLFSNEF